MRCVELGKAHHMPTNAGTAITGEPKQTAAMTHLRCPACRLRVPRSSGLEDASCPGCAAPLELCSSRGVVGYSLWAPAGLTWSAANLDAVALAAALAPPAPSRSP
jgi:hypothetical protein